MISAAGNRSRDFNESKKNLLLQNFPDYVVAVKEVVDLCVCLCLCVCDTALVLFVLFFFFIFFNCFMYACLDGQRFGGIVIFCLVQTLLS